MLVTFKNSEKESQGRQSDWGTELGWEREEVRLGSRRVALSWRTRRPSCGLCGFTVNRVEPLARFGQRD